MAPPAGSTRIVFYGALAGGEEWSSGFWVTGVPVGDSALANELAADVDAQANDSGGNGAMNYVVAKLLPATASWDGTKVYHYAGGTNQASVVGIFTTATARPGLHNQTMPNQVCQVVSLRTGLAGRRYRGRMYMPAAGETLEADGTFANDVTTALAAHWGGFFTQIHTALNAQVVVVSGTASVATNVTQVVVDDRPDIQRRRAESQAILFRALASVT